MRCCRWLVMAGLMVAGAGAWAQTVGKDAGPERFGEATIRPDTTPGPHFYLSMPRAPEFTATQVSLTYLICLAYEVSDYQVVNRPAWMDTEYFDITAKAKDGVGLSYQQLRRPLQTLLQERFDLRFHRGEKSLAGYDLVLANGGPKLRRSSQTTEGGFALPGTFRLTGASMNTVANALSRPLGVPVRNATGVAGVYDVLLRFDPKNQGNAKQPSLFAAVQEQLGLKLEPAKVPVETVVVDHVDKMPTEN